MSGPARPIVAVVVAYHGADDLDGCLATLAGTLPVTVIDNSSSTAVAAVAERNGASYIEPGANLGFGAGVNRALREIMAGEPRDVLVVNPDAAITPAAIDRLAGELSRPGHDRIGVVAPRVRDDDGGEERVVWPFPGPARAWAEAIGLGGLPARERFVIGAVMLLRWEALQAVGLFDERYFLYAEETDWQRRALALGWRAALCDEATATHLGARSSSDPLRREALFHAATEIYIRKWNGAGGWLVYRGAAIVGASLRAVVLRGERRRAAARRARLYLHGPRRTADRYAA